MNLGKILSCAVLSLLLLSACDNNKDDYSGLAALVAEKNEVRQAISEETARKKAKDKTLEREDVKEDTSIASSKKKKEISSIVLYERNIEIVDSSSQKSLAKGVASLNKEGKIIKIKIIKD
jgi:hypothetical protein